MKENASSEIKVTEAAQYLEARRAATNFGVDAYKQWLTELEREIKYDLSSKAIALLTCLSAYSQDPQNLMFKGDSSIGKTWVAVNVTKYFPKNDVWMLGALSPTALVHDKGQLEDASTGQPLDENYVRKYMNQWRVDNPDATKEQEKTKYHETLQAWQELPKKYVVDLSHKILLFLEAPHIETFNRLRPILSHDTWEITYKFTDKDASKNMVTQTVTLRGWPATIFCTTDKEWMEDFSTRSFTGTPSTQKDKLLAAIQLIATKKSRPWLCSDNGSETFRQFIQVLKERLLEGWKPIIPYFSEIAGMTSPVLGRDMRDFKHIGSLIEIMALLHYQSRPKIMFGDLKYVLATYQDWAYVLEIWRDVESTTRTGLSAEEMYLYECLKTVEKDNLFPTIKDIVDEYNRHQAKKISSKAAYKYLENLLSVAYADKKRDDDRLKEEGGDARRNIYHSIQREGILLFRAGEYFQSYFKLEHLEKWFVDLKNYSPQNDLHIIYSSQDSPMRTAEDHAEANHILTFEDRQLSLESRAIVESLFLGEYFSEPTTLESNLIQIEPADKNSPTPNIQKGEESP